MLHNQAIKPGTLPILERIMNLKEFASFHLVGGTALALKFGHRISIDLDFFSNENFDYAVLTNALQKEFADKLELESNKPRWGIFCFIDGIKVDVIKYAHPIIYEPEIIDGTGYIVHQILLQ